MDLAALLRSARGLELAAGESAARPATKLRYLDLYDMPVTHSLLATASRQLFADGHYARAVEQAFKAVNALIRQRTAFMDEGRPLMERAFSGKSPKLAVNALKTRTDTDEQVGTMMLFAGAMAAVRNVRTHDLHRQDNPEVALELLAFANYLMRVADGATVRA